VTLAIDVQGLSKSFGALKAVDDISLQIEQGHITGFLGPNGSGKTTTLRMLCGLLTPDPGASGQVLGLDFPREAAAIKRQTGYMTQRFSLYEDLTIEENLNFVARVYSLEDVPRTVDETLTKLGLQHRRKQLAGQLSGGWKQRLALAAAVMHQPRLLLLDEPTAGVDPQARRALSRDRVHLQREADCARHGRRGDRRLRPHHLRGRRPARRPPGAGARWQARCRDGRLFRPGLARQRHQPRSAGGRHRPLSQGSLSLGGSAAFAGRRIHPPDAQRRREHR
jgi:ABC-type Na+ transport system ATPase subunit NatA